MNEEVCYCFVDTNVFLHYQTFTEINWTKELGMNHVVLVVCYAVIHELDEKKRDDNSKIRERAKKVISKLNEIWQGNKQVKDNVELLLITDEPILDWDSRGLDPKIIDDRIIASIICEQERKDNLILIAHDFGLKLKAESKGIKLHLLSERLLLPDTKSPEEEELTKLREENIRLKSRLPKLNLKLLSDGEFSDFVKFSSRKYSLMSDEDIQTQLSKARSEFSGFSPFWDESDLERYGRDVGKYIEKLRVYLEHKRQYDDLFSRTLLISPVIVNDGTTPADDIEVFLNFPQGFVPYNIESFPDKPKLPEKPKQPRTIFDEAGATRAGIPVNQNLRLSLLNGEKPQSEDVVDEKPSINDCEVRYNLPKLKHGMNIYLEPVYVEFYSVESAESFHIDYRIHADNITSKIIGQLNIVVEKLLDVDHS